MTEENYFKELYAIDVSDRLSKKNGLNYLPWADCWAEIKKIHPNAFYTVYEDNDGRFWWDDGRSGWVKAGVTINGLEHIERLAVMDFKNKSIPADQITSVDANKSLQRAITKACGRHGLGLRMYEGEEFPETPPKPTKTTEQVLQEDKIKELRKLILDECNKKITAGLDKEVLYQIIADNNPDKKKNPNAIKDIKAAEKVIELIKNMEVK
jgi:hypothetical protein